MLVLTWPSSCSPTLWTRSNPRHSLSPPNFSGSVSCFFPPSISGHLYPSPLQVRPFPAPPWWCCSLGPCDFWLNTLSLSGDTCFQVSTTMYVVMASNLHVLNPGMAPAHVHWILAPCGWLAEGSLVWVIGAVEMFPTTSVSPPLLLPAEVKQSSTVTTIHSPFPPPHCLSQKQI